MPEHGTQSAPGAPRAYQRLDPLALVKQAYRVGVEAVVFFARDNHGNSYYPTEKGHPLADLDGRDVVGEFIGALHERGMRAVAYFQPIRDRRLWEEHPEWRQINNDGTEKVPQRWLQKGQRGHRLICPLGGAAEQIFAELHDLLARYPLDGVWWDRVGDLFGPDDRYPCFCTSCQTRFEADTGDALPRHADWDSETWRTFYNWRANALLAFQQRAMDMVSARSPDCCLISNYAFHGMSMANASPLSVDWEAAFDASHVCALEMQHMVSYLHLSSHPMLLNALTDRSTEIILWNNGHIGDGFVRSEPAAQVAAITAVARGHAISFHDTLDHAGRADQRLFSMMRATFDLIERFTAFVPRSAPVKDVAVLISPNTFTWYGRGRPEAYTAEFMGTVKQMIGIHVPLDLISDRHLTPSGVADYRMIVLPMAACLSETAVTVLESWVRAGGVLVATHESGRMDAQGREPGANRLFDLLGLRHVRSDHASMGWMRARDQSPLRSEWGDHPVPFRMGHVEVEATDAEVLADIVPTVPGLDTFLHFIGPPADAPQSPAVTRRRVGEGYAMYAAVALGAFDLEWGVPELDGVLRTAERQAGEPLVRVDAPACVEMIARRTAEGVVLVVLTNLQGEVSRAHRMQTQANRTLGVREILPVYQVAIRCGFLVGSADELLRSDPVHLDARGRTVYVDILHATCVVKITPH